MAQEEVQVIAFNRGLISDLARARIDIKRYAFSATVMDNWMARTLGSMMLRPGTGYKGTTASNLAARFLPFVFRIDDTALIEFTNAQMRVWRNDTPIARATVTSAVTNGNFTTNVANWTDNDEAGATSDWVTDGGTGGYLRLLGNGTAAAIRDQQIVVPGGSIGVEHGLQVVIARGPVTIRLGSTSGGGQYMADTTLRTGVHSLTITPTGASFYIRFMSRLDRYTLVDSCNVEAAGAMTLASPYLTADLGNIRGGPESQSADVTFLAGSGYQQRRIERHTTNGWSLVLYQADDGPFGDINTTAITITPSALLGNITLTASSALFLSSMVGGLFSLTSNGQSVTKTETAQNTFTDPIRVTGVGAARTFTLAVANLTATGSTVTMQRSLDSDTGPWTDVASYVADTTTTYADSLDNQIAWYRIGVKTGGYVAGTITTSLSYPSGSTTGFVRITSYTSSTLVDAEVLTHLGGVAATDTWAEGEWSDHKGWPTAVALVEARLGWAGKTTMWLSTTDAYDTFLDENADGSAVGDSGPIARTIGFGPLDIINWMLPLQRLILGGQSSEYSARSSAFDDPLTPTNISIKACSGQGSYAVQAVKVDIHGAYVQRGGTRVYELLYSTEVYDYTSSDLTVFYPEASGEPDSGTYFVRMAVQRQPETRIHLIRSDGKAAILIYDTAEQIKCWLTASTDGNYEDVVVLPSQAGEREDRVYYVVNRTINGATVRYLERWAPESECQGSTLNKQMDAFVTFTNATPSTTVTGLTHLIGETVVCWHDGICEEDADGDVQTYVVTAGGTITLNSAATTGVVGLPYDAQWRGTFMGSNISRRNKIEDIGLMLKNTHARGLRFGPTLTDAEMDYLPLVYQGTPVDTDTIYSSYDDDPATFPGGWGTDQRMCLKASAPRPVTVLAAKALGQGNA